MNAKTSNEDLAYEQQMLELNSLGNALLSGLIADKIAENKRKIVNKYQIVGELASYKVELDKLRSLKIANIHNTLKINEENDQSVQIEAAGKLLHKIEEILDNHVKYNAKDVICQQELEQLKNNMNVLESLKNRIADIPSTAAAKLEKLKEFSSDLNNIIDYIDSTSAKLSKSQWNIVKDAAELMSL